MERAGAGRGIGRYLGTARLSLRSGDDLANLYRQYRDEIVRYVTRTFGSGPPDPDDVVQVVFERYAAAAGAQRVLHPRAFLYRSARNFVIDERRRTAVRLDYAVDQKAIADPCDHLDGERVLESKLRWAAIEAAIAQLDQRSREMLLMSRIEGLSSAEIARRKGCSPTLVKAVLGRALVVCYRALDEDD